MIRHLALFLLLLTALRAVELPGTWSNGKDEFYEVSLKLRIDGQALFTSGMFPGFGLWKETDTGLLFTLYEGGQSLAIPFTYDPATELLTGRLQESEVVLKKISNEEAPDVLAMIKKHAAEEEEREAKMTRFEYRTFANRPALGVFLKEWMESDERQRPEKIFLSVGDETEQLTVQGFRATCLFTVLLEHRRLAKLSGSPLKLKLLPRDTVSDLPGVYELSEVQRNALDQLAQTPGVWSSPLVIGEVSIFKTEGFIRQLQFSVESDTTPDALTLAEQILDILWGTSPKEIQAKLQFRVVGRPSAK